MSQRTTRSTGSRGGIACHRCHNLKIKCNGERPCKKCYSKNHQCTYPIRDRNLTVSECYLNSLRSELNELRKQVNLAGYNPPISSHNPASGPANVALNSQGNLATSDRAVKDPTAEVFVSKLRELVSPHLPPNPSGSPSRRASSSVSARPDTGLFDSTRPYSYVFLSSDNSSSKLSLELPPFPQTAYFLDTFDLIMGSDYHWFLHNSFRKQVEILYQDPRSPYGRDRIWLCRLLTTLAIGESYVPNSPLVISFDGSGGDTDAVDIQASNPGTDIRKSTTPPGIELFEQAMNLLHIPYEEPRIEHVEVLNLISFYCYSLNRRKTAFVYAGLCMRLSNMIGLDKPAGLGFSALDREQRKRLWWTCYCLDKNTSTEMGWKPAYVLPNPELDYPSNDGLSQEDLLEFHDPGFLTAQVKLTELKLTITETAYRLKLGDLVSNHEIRHCLNMLQSWESDLAPNVGLNLLSGIPSERSKLRTLRTSSSLFLKYNHCTILLLRPFLLRKIASALDGSAADGFQEDQRHFGNTCLRAARHSLGILSDVSRYGQLAKYGFWESLHLFSSLSILSMTKLIIRRWPTILGLSFLDDDDETYAAGRELLQGMSRVGNCASDDHLRMLLEIENLEKSMAGTSQDTTVAMPEFSFDITEWQNMFFDSDVGANEVDISWSSRNMV